MICHRSAEFLWHKCVIGAGGSTWNRKDPFKYAGEHAGRFWGGVSKVAKVAGVLAASPKARLGTRTKTGAGA